MAILKFNKPELVNLDYSLRREVLCTNKFGAYCNTSIVACNTRKYHGLLVVPLDEMGGKFVLLSAMDDSIAVNGQQFNLGIHCWGDEYDPKGHKYVIDFDADGVPTITYKVGRTVIAKSVVMDPLGNQTLIRYRLISAPAGITLLLKPFLAFRDIHSLTNENPVANTDYTPADNGAGFCMYSGFPKVYIQTNLKSEYRHQPYWYKGVTYSDEYRRGFDCREDLLVPGVLYLKMKEGDEAIVSVSACGEMDHKTLKAKFSRIAKNENNTTSHKKILLDNAETFKVYNSEGRKMICAGYSWMKTGLLRETIACLPGLTLYSNGSKAEFEEILDNLIEAEGERLFNKTTQIEAPLALTDAIQQYIEFGADEKKVWKKYGPVLKKIIESYAQREEASICPNGLLWTQKFGVALSWMNAYINGSPVTERDGFQVETNALWYNALCFAIEMEGKYGVKNNAFISRWTSIRDLVRNNYQPTFLINRGGYKYLADYVNNSGQHDECRPNMMWPACVPYPLLDDEVIIDIVAKVNNELVTRRGIRTLSPRSNDYKGVYEGSQTERDLAYHQGCTFTMLLGPFVALGFKMMGPSFCYRAKWLTEGYFEDINKHGVGSFSELYDGDPPHEPHGAISSATATAALTRCIYLMEKFNDKEEK